MHSHCVQNVDVEFGRLQAKDMLQHLWTGPISNASLDVVQGSRSVEVRSAGVTKVKLAFSRISDSVLICCCILDVLTCFVHSFH